MWNACSADYKAGKLLDAIERLAEVNLRLVEALEKGGDDGFSSDSGIPEEDMPPLQGSDTEGRGTHPLRLSF